MGSLGSKTNNSSTESLSELKELRLQIQELMGTTDRKKEIQELREEIKALKSIDQNKDSKLSKEEVDEWLRSQQKDLENFKAKIKEDIQRQKECEFEAKYLEMQKQIESLKSINRDLQNRLYQNSLSRYQKQDSSSKTISTKTDLPLGTKPTDKTDKVDTLSVKTRRMEQSKKQIDAFVEKLLSDENVNIKYLPDFAERQIYRNMFTILFGLVDTLAETTEIKVLGHRITLNLTPDDESNTNTETKQTENQSSQSSQKKTVKIDKPTKRTIARKPSVEQQLEKVKQPDEHSIMNEIGLDDIQDNSPRTTTGSINTKTQTSDEYGTDGNIYG